MKALREPLRKRVRAVKKADNLGKGPALKYSMDCNNGKSLSWDTAINAYIDVYVNGGATKKMKLAYSEVVSIITTLRELGAAPVSSLLPQRIMDGHKGTLSAAVVSLLKLFPICSVTYSGDCQILSDLHNPHCFTLAELAHLRSNSPDQCEKDFDLAVAVQEGLLAGVVASGLETNPEEAVIKMCAAAEEDEDEGSSSSAAAGGVAADAGSSSATAGGVAADVSSSSDSDVEAVDVRGQPSHVEIFPQIVAEVQGFVLPDAVHNTSRPLSYFHGDAGHGCQGCRLACT